MLEQVSAIPTIGVKNMEAARDFYENKLGLEPVKKVMKKFRTTRPVTVLSKSIKASSEEPIRPHRLLLRWGKNSIKF